MTTSATETTAISDVVTRWVRTVEVDDAAAAAVMAAGEMAWLTDTHEIAGWGTAARIAVGHGADRFAAAGAALALHVAAMRGRELPADTAAGPGTPGPVAFASFTFDADRAGSILVIPHVTVRRRDGRAWVTVVDDRPVARQDLVLPTAIPQPPPAGRVRYAGTTATEIAWLDAVDRAVRRIRSGHVEKVVLARDRMLYGRTPLAAEPLLHRLRTAFPTCFTFHVDGLVGASPELLVRRDAGTVTSLVLAGTAPRGRDERHDAELGRALLTSAKDLSEHRPAVASVARVLAPVVSDLRVADHPSLLRLANVQHLATPVSGVLADDVGVLDLAGRLHPTAAVGGTPTERALALIGELETIDRERYAGPVGWVDATGDGELAIALRCAQLSGSRARLFAGAGIVAESLPEAELEETRLKLRAMQSAFEQA